jgi:hypothetical protein
MRRRAQISNGLRNCFTKLKTTRWLSQRLRSNEINCDLIHQIKNTPVGQDSTSQDAPDAQLDRNG